MRTRDERGFGVPRSDVVVNADGKRLLHSGVECQFSEDPRNRIWSQNGLHPRATRHGCVPS